MYLLFFNEHKQFVYKKNLCILLINYIKKQKI